MKKLILVALVINATLIGVRAWQEYRTASAMAPTENGDVNGDGFRDVSDAIYLLLHLFRGGPEPVAIAGSEDLEMRVENLELAVNELRAAPGAHPLRGDRDRMASLLRSKEIAAEVPTVALQGAERPSSGNPPARLLVGERELGRVLGFSGQEGISTTYRFDVVLSTRERLAVDSFIGVSARLAYERGDRARTVAGVITSMGPVAIDAEETTYALAMEPRVSLLRLTTDSRIFQDKSVPQIVDEILGEHEILRGLDGVEGPHPIASCVVQYNESDWDFVTRLLQEEGIYYWFEHEDGEHRMVVADSSSSYAPTGERLPYFGHEARPPRPGEEFVRTFGEQSAAAPDRYTLDDFEFEDPSTELVASRSLAVAPQAQEYEIYEYPGLYSKRGDGEVKAQRGLERAQLDRRRFRGTGNAGILAPGRTVVIAGADGAFAGTYLVESVTHLGLLDDRGTLHYANSFTCLPSTVEYRPRRTVPKPVIHGVQTAKVVGPAGTEIHTDEYGRVKVQFHWDRAGAGNDTSSCWIRVSQMHAGAGFGAIWLPRIGQEVIVSFEEGNPDRPLIVGRSYNAEHPPPYDLPASKSISTLKSESTPGGGGSNEIRFEDAQGQEELFIHARKDMLVETENVLDIRARGDLVLSSDNAGSAGVSVGERHRDNAVVAWASISTDGAVLSDFGVSSVERVRAGHYRITIDAEAAFATTLVPVVSAMAEPPFEDGPPVATVTRREASSFEVIVTGTGRGIAVDSALTLVVMAR